MFEIARDLTIVYVFAFITGFGPYELIVPVFLKRRYLAALLPPGLGLLQLSIVTGYAIYKSEPIARALPVSFAIGVATLVLALAARFVRHKPIFSISRLRRALRAVRLKPLSLSILVQTIFVASLCGILWPVLQTGMATTPYRVGIDQVGYAETAQYLVEGGTLQSARKTLLTELQTTNFAKAKAQSAKDVHIETYVDSEFLLKANRWGYPGSLAALTLLTGNAHVFKLEFLMLILSYALLLGLIYHIARRTLALPAAYAYLAMLAVAFNCNLLNIYYEGQLAQIFAFPYFILIFVLFVRARTRRDELSRLRSTEFAKGAALFALLTAGLFSAFNEALVLILGTVACTLAFDILFYRRTSITASALVAVGFTGGFFTVFPFSHQWLSYTSANLSGLSRAGFWQPHWASFAEMLGLIDMYQSPNAAPVDRTAANIDLNMGLSVAAMFLIVRFILRERDIDRSFWLAAPVIVLAEYVKSHYFDDILNYPFMKLYTMFVPLMACLVLVGLHRFARKRNVALRFGQYVACVAIIVTGCLYVARYVGQSQYVTADMFALYRDNGPRRFDRFALVTNHADIREYMYVPLTSMHWVDEKNVQKYLSADLQRPVAFIVRQDDVPCRQCIARYFAGQIVYEDATFLLIDAGLKLRDLCAGDVKRQTLATLGYDAQATWHREQQFYDDSYKYSYRQCDFGYITKLLQRALGPA